MGFQEQNGVIEWKVHFTSSISKVYGMLTSDEGRKQFWAEETKEANGIVEFHILNYPKYQSKIVAKEEPHLFKLEYFGTTVTFHLKKTDDGGTDLQLIAETPNEQIKLEMTSGWVSVLMAMKAAVDFGVDLRNHHPDRVWDNGFLDN